MLVTTATSQRSKPRPSRRIPPRAASNTAASTCGLSRTLRALRGPAQSPSSMVRPDTSMPSLEVIPTTRPAERRMCATRRVTVVLPLVPVTHTMGMRPFSPGGKSVSTMASPTGRGAPTEGARCIASPGPALTSTTTPPWSSSRCEMSFATTSSPATSRPTIWAARAAWAAMLG